MSMRKVTCCACLKQFEAHQLINNLECPHCEQGAIIMLHICPRCFQQFRKRMPKRKPYKCPVCDGRGGEGLSCHPCKGTGIVWDEGPLMEVE